MAAPRAEMADGPSITPFAQAILDSFDGGVVVFDSKGKLVFTNEAARLVTESLLKDHEPNSEALLPEYAKRGGVLRSVFVEDDRVGQTVFLPGDASPSTLRDREREAIIATLEANNWKLAESADQLGISRTTLWRRLKIYGIKRRRRSRRTTDG